MEPTLSQRAISGLWLQERLDQVKSVSGCGLTTLPELIELSEGQSRQARGTRDLGPMFDHVKFGCSDYAASKAFFVKALETARRAPS
jgi:hypothetical protein